MGLCRGESRRDYEKDERRLLSNQVVSLTECVMSPTQSSAKFLQTVGRIRVLAKRMWRREGRLGIAG